MEVYSYYYGASVEKGICVQAQSKELSKLHLDSTLMDLSSLHALESSEHSNEKLSFLLGIEGYCVLGVSYIESPNNSGYTRSAPCSLQYIVRGEKIAQRVEEYGKIINFINFRKPSSIEPAVMNMFPLADSGYYYRNNPKVLSALVDGLIQVALSEKDVLLIALPKGKNSEYATARYTMAEMINCIPNTLRTNIRFFTGIPVMEGINNPLTGYDTAMKYGANVIFCPNEYFSQLKSHRNCIGIDMDNPSSQTGFFAEYIANAPDTGDALSKVMSNATEVSYSSLNKAAQQVASGHIVTIDMVRDQLNKNKEAYQNLEKDHIRLSQEYNDINARWIQAQEQSNKYLILEKEYKRIKQENDNLQIKLDRVEEQRSKIRDYQRLERENEQLKQDCYKLSTKLEKAGDQYGELLYKVKNGKEESNHIILKLLGIILLVCVVAFATFMVMKPIIEKNVISKMEQEVPEEDNLLKIIPQTEENKEPDEAKPEDLDDSFTENQNESKEEKTELVSGAVSSEASAKSEELLALELEAEEQGSIDNQGESVLSVDPSIEPTDENTVGNANDFAVILPEDTPTIDLKVTVTPYANPGERTINNTEPSGKLSTKLTEVTPNPLSDGMDIIIERYGKTNEKGVNIRDIASINGTQIEQIPKGTVVWMIGEVEVKNNKKSEKWTRIIYNGSTVGYIRSDLLTVLSDEDNNTNIQKYGIPEL